MNVFGRFTSFLGTAFGGLFMPVILFAVACFIVG